MMLRTLLAGLGVSLTTLSAMGVTFSNTPDKLLYTVGEEISFSIFGDAEGAADGSIFGQIQWDAALADIVSAEQGQLTTLGTPWALGLLRMGPGFSDAFNQAISSPPRRRACGRGTRGRS